MQITYAHAATCQPCLRPAPPCDQQRRVDPSAPCIPHPRLTSAPALPSSSRQCVCRWQRRPFSRQRLPRPCYSGEKDITDLLSQQTEALTEGDEDTDELEEELGELQELGFRAELTEVQEKYRNKLARKLKEEKERAKQAEIARSQEFQVGKYAYERGQYQNAVVALEAALDKEGLSSQLGGDIQMWLALAYQACGREEECIATYKSLEDTHPVPRIRRQAGHLRYIIEAPKLELRPEERVEIPVLKDIERKKIGRTSYARSPKPSGSRERKLTLEERFMEEYKPPAWVTNRYVWVAAVVLGVGLAVYSVRL